MLNTLRGRFILSHIIPLLIVMPLMGIATIYLIEQQILIPSLLSELKSNALALSRLAARDQEIWQDPAYAQKLLRAGVNVKLNRFDGMIHGFLRMVSRLDRAREALNEISTFLRNNLNRINGDR